RAKPARGLQERGRARRHAAFALHGLEDDRADLVAGACELLLERGDVVVRDVSDARRVGPESRGVLGLAAGGDREQRAAVEGVLRRDDAEFLLAEMIVRVAARELERRLVRLRAGV